MKKKVIDYINLTNIIKENQFEKDNMIKKKYLVEIWKNYNYISIDNINYNIDELLLEFSDEIDINYYKLFLKYKLKMKNLKIDSILDLFLNNYLYFKVFDINNFCFEVFFNSINDGSEILKKLIKNIKIFNFDYNKNDLKIININNDIILNNLKFKIISLIKKSIKYEENQATDVKEKLLKLFNISFLDTYNECTIGNFINNFFYNFDNQISKDDLKLYYLIITKNEQLKNYNLLINKIINDFFITKKNLINILNNKKNSLKKEEVPIIFEKILLKIKIIGYDNFSSILLNKDKITLENLKDLISSLNINYIFYEFIEFKTFLQLNNLLFTQNNKNNISFFLYNHKFLSFIKKFLKENKLKSNINTKEPTIKLIYENLFSKFINFIKSKYPIIGDKMINFTNLWESFIKYFDNVPFESINILINSLNYEYIDEKSNQKLYNLEKLFTYLISQNNILNNRNSNTKIFNTESISLNAQTNEDNTLKENNDRLDVLKKFKTILLSIKEDELLTFPILKKFKNLNSNKISLKNLTKFFKFNFPILSDNDILNLLKLNDNYSEFNDINLYEFCNILEKNLLIVN